MKEIISFFTLAFTSFKFIRRYFDGKKLDYFSLMFFNFVFILIFAGCLFYVDAILWNEVNQHSVLIDILLMIDLIVLFLLVAIYSATYGISLNHFILYVDNNNSVFERKNLVSPFNKDLLKIQSEDDLVEKHAKKQRVYQYIYNYQIENYQYIDSKSEKYEEFVCQQRKINYQRLFRYTPKIKLYFWILVVIFFITSAASLFFLQISFLLIMVIIIHILTYILSIGFMSKISITLHRENDKDKVKLMRYVKSLKH
ncbi:hypothetical protein [Staphylococcus equorum]|uniref:hypothetical protein n=1 Tax=Staphylococcus equorum TaxID=246432 RepID=UPI0008537EE8|nr:hypothetical protein [Staphylococcus equorum]MEB7778868.1 hypothetical protein [Staphylococcus equorum]OEK72752.1 hypothetical protein AST03_13130 [Staphylococcus equorum]